MNVDPTKAALGCLLLDFFYETKINFFPVYSIIVLVFLLDAAES